MKPTLRLICIVLCLAGIIQLSSASIFGSDEGEGSTNIEKINPADFQSKVDNPYFPLVPGTTYNYIETVGKDTSENEVTVTHDTTLIEGVTCVVVHDVVKSNGVVKEETFDWYAQDREGNVWYFGEDTKEFKAHNKVVTRGSWKTGAKGAQPGIIMKGKPEMGEPYRQEYLKGEAEDMGQIVSVNDSAVVPYGSYTGCVKTKDWSMLEAGHEFKWYAKGIGCIRSQSTGGETSVLVSVTKP